MITNLLHKPFEELTLRNALAGLRQWYINNTTAFWKISHGMTGIATSLHKMWNPGLQMLKSRYEDYNF